MAVTLGTSGASLLRWLRQSAAFDAFARAGEQFNRAGQMNWILIDGNNWFAQCYYANPENVTRNFLNRLTTLLGQVPFERAAICWDVGDSFRVEISGAYKAHREKKAPEFHQMLRETRDAVSMPNVSNVSMPQYEADDCIASLTRMALDEGQRAILFSADKDLHQLLSSGNVTQVTKVDRVAADKLAMHVTTADALVEKYSVRADQWVDYRAIVGDPSDGIAGCPGLGKAAATEVLCQTGTLEAFYKNPFAARLTEKQRNALLNYKPHLPEVRRLLQLVDDLPLAPQLCALV